MGNRNESLYFGFLFTSGIYLTRVLGNVFEDYVVPQIKWFEFFVFIFQVVELDFQYPSEGIHKRWGEGYRITAVASTPDQTAIVLSVCADPRNSDTQETLRTDYFPGTQTKVMRP
jgi:hypothetical protein